MPIADVEDAIAEQKPKRDVDDAETQQAERKAKQRKDDTKARERQTDLQAIATRARCQQRQEKQRRKESCANTFVRIAVNP